jgi:inner membrane protein
LQHLVKIGTVPPVPSPVGHALAGVAAAWTVDLLPGRRAWRTAQADTSWYRRAGDGLTLACAALGALPDADLFFRGHRTYSHSVGAVILLALLSAAAAAAARQPVARVGLMCAAAYTTHLLLDWMGVDTSPPYGIQAFWPFTDTWYISGWDLFLPTERRQIFSLEAIHTNALAVAKEVAILTPVLVGIWLVRVKALAGLPPEVPCGNHAAK